MLYVSPDGVHVVRSAVMGVAFVWTCLDMRPTCTGFRACKQKGKPLCKIRRPSLLNVFRPCSCHSAVQKAHLGGSDGLWDLGCFVVVPTRELCRSCHCLSWSVAALIVVGMRLISKIVWRVLRKSRRCWKPSRPPLRNK